LRGTFPASRAVFFFVIPGEKTADAGFEGRESRNKKGTDAEEKAKPERPDRGDAPGPPSRARPAGGDKTLGRE